MELKFVETIEGKEWEAEFEAPSDFNLHLERVHGGSLVVSQRGTTSGEYAAAFAKGMYEGQAVIDYDFGALVYPKWIKVVSGSEVVNASVNFNEGGGSGNGSSSNDDETLYYKFEEPLNMWDASDLFYKEENLFSRVRGSIDNANYFYGTVSSLNVLFGFRYSSKPNIDAFEFKPIQLVKSFSDTSVVTYKDYETLSANIPEICPPATRITAEEYWSKFKSE